MMPGQEAVLTDEKIASIVTYVRGSFGNTAPPVGPEVVASARKKFADRKTPWTEAELLAFGGAALHLPRSASRLQRCGGKQSKHRNTGRVGAEPCGCTRWGRPSIGNQLPGGISSGGTCEPCTRSLPDCNATCRGADSSCTSRSYGTSVPSPRQSSQSTHLPPTRVMSEALDERPCCFVTERDGARATCAYPRGDAGVTGAAFCTCNQS
jgi:hypothetical protein